MKKGKKGNNQKKNQKKIIIASIILIVIIISILILIGSGENITGNPVMDTGKKTVVGIGKAQIPISQPRPGNPGKSVSISYPILETKTTYSVSVIEFANKYGVSADTIISMGRQIIGCSSCNSLRNYNNDVNCKKCVDGMLKAMGKI